MSRLNPRITIIITTVVLSICAVFFAMSQKGSPPDWTMIGQNETGIMFYDTASVVHYQKGIVSVNTRHILSRQMKEGMAEVLPEMTRVFYSTSLDRIDCRKWEYTQANIVFRDANGDVLSTHNKHGVKTEPGSRPIPPDTFVERLASDVCTPSDLGSPDGKPSTGVDSAGKEHEISGRSGISEKDRNELAKLLERGDLQGLVAYCQVWTMAEPKNAAAWTFLGYAYGISGETGKGIVYLKKGLELDPRNMIAWFNLGAAYNQSNQREKAIDSYEKCLSIDPDFADAWFKLGMNYKATGQENKATNAYYELKRINPAKAEIFYKNVIAR